MKQVADLPEVLHAFRAGCAHGEAATQSQLDALADEWQDRREDLRPGEADETFALVDVEGNLTGLVAPRWLCHLVGLRHRCVHVLLTWRSPSLGRVLVLQVRNWTKSDSPGHLDISAAGHNKGLVSSEQTAYEELDEELGLSRGALQDGYLSHKGGYASYREHPPKNFHNAQWCEIYTGRLTTEGLEQITFRDSEVVGLYLCPMAQLPSLLEQTELSIADALRNTGPRCCSVGGSE